jgi:hypothetical protein
MLGSARAVSAQFMPTAPTSGPSRTEWRLRISPEAAPAGRSGAVDLTDSPILPQDVRHGSSDLVGPGADGSSTCTHAPCGEPLLMWISPP